MIEATGSPEISVHSTTTDIFFFTARMITTKPHTLKLFLIMFTFRSQPYQKKNCTVRSGTHSSALCTVVHIPLHCAQWYTFLCTVRSGTQSSALCAVVHIPLHLTVGS
jgi:hypothetical protein